MGYTYERKLRETKDWAEYYDEYRDKEGKRVKVEDS
jgi:hypothetical protein